MQTIILHNSWALGDTVCLSALFRDVHRAYPGKYRLLASGHYRNVFWRNNPDAEVAPDNAQGMFVKLGYQAGIREAGRGTKVHFLSWFHRAFAEKTGVEVPVTEPKGRIVLSPDEAAARPPGRYWVVVAGGKMDMTAKVWSAAYWQRAVDMLAAQGVRCVQAGGDFNRHFHPSLRNVEQYVGKTRSERQFFSLIAGAEGVICGVTAAMHVAAVFDKPCVVIAGGREEPWWEGYVNCWRETAFGPACAPVKVEHRFLHTVGLLDCKVGNLVKGCWRDRTVPVDQADHADPKRRDRLCLRPVEIGNQAVPECLSLITPDHVVEAVMDYYEKGVLPPIGKPTGKYRLPMIGQVGVAAADAVPCALPTGEPGYEVAVVTAPPGGGVVAVDPGEPGEDRQGEAVFKKDDAGRLSLAALGPPPEPTWFKEWDKQLPKRAEPRAGEPPAFAALDHPYVGGKFTLFVLGYADHLDLVRRCVDSIVNTCPRPRFDLRVALNQPSPRVEAYVGGLADAGVVTKVYPDYGDRKKYPAMRRMFWDADCPIATPYVCWFDDDSWCRAGDWMVVLARAIIANHPHQCRLYGAWMYHDLAGVKRPGALREQWFRRAKWWRGRDLYAGSGRRLAPNGSQIVFASGGFWALATHVIREADVPDERLNHNGGDITIGCQVTQAGYKVADFSPRPAKAVVAWSDAPRRGHSEQFPWA